MSEQQPPRKCIEAGCQEVAGTPWTRYWCAKHDALRRENISASLTEMLGKLQSADGLVIAKSG